MGCANNVPSICIRLPRPYVTTVAWERRRLLLRRTLWTFWTVRFPFLRGCPKSDKLHFGKIGIGVLRHGDDVDSQSWDSVSWAQDNYMASSQEDESQKEGCCDHFPGIFLECLNEMSTSSTHCSLKSSRFWELAVPPSSCHLMTL